MKRRFSIFLPCFEEPADQGAEIEEKILEKVAEEEKADEIKEAVKEALEEVQEEQQAEAEAEVEKMQDEWMREDISAIRSELWNINEKLDRLLSMETEEAEHITKEESETDIISIETEEPKQDVEPEAVKPKRTWI